MADNFQVTPGSGITISANDVSGVHYQRVKIEHGLNGKSVSDPIYLEINSAAAGDLLVVAADANNKIRIISAFLYVSATNTLTFKRGNTSIVGPILLDSKAGFVLPYNPMGWQQTGLNEALNLNIQNASQVSGVVVVVKEP